MGVVEGRVVGRARLAVKGSVGVVGVGDVGVGAVVLVGTVVFARLSGRSHAVCYCDLLALTIGSCDEAVKIRTLSVSSWNFPLRMVLVMLLTRSAVPIWPLPPRRLKPKPRFGLFGSPIALAAALMTLLRSTRSCTAGVVAMAVGIKMMPVTSIV